MSFKDSKGSGKLERIVAAIKESSREILGRKLIYWQKRDLSMVSNIDIAIQDAITGIILHNYSHDRIICEERGAPDSESKSAFTWIIDPIDGTDNFIHGKNEYGISVGLMEGGRFIEALLLFPGLGESYYAGRGRGIWKDEVLFQPAVCAEYGGRREIILCSKTYESKRHIFESSGHVVKCYRCATYSLLRLLKGEASMYHVSNTMIYDVGPMSFVLELAGIPVLDDKGGYLQFSASRNIIPFVMALSDISMKEETYKLFCM